MALLRYVALRSDVLISGGGLENDRFQLAPRYRGESHFQHMMDQYVGGYGPCLTQLDKIMNEPDEGRSLVNLHRHAQAFCRPAHRNIREIIHLVECLNVRALIDIGCGGGQLLRELGDRNFGLRGIGIDSNPEMVKYAQGQVALDGNLGHRLEFICDDWESAVQTLPVVKRDGIEVTGYVLDSCSHEGLWFGRFELAGGSSDDFVIG